MLNVTIANNENATISVIDLAGKVISSVNSKLAKNTVSVSDLTNGIYFVEVKTENNVELIKFIKK